MAAGIASLGGDLLLAKVFSNPSGLFNYDDMWNTRALQACEMPSSNGIGDARSFARLYASCIGPVDGVRTLDDAAVTTATREEACGPDEVLIKETCFGLGFMLRQDFMPISPNAGAFGHPGAGGSIGMADPDAKVGFGYVMNKILMLWVGEANSNPTNTTVISAPANRALAGVLNRSLTAEIHGEPGSAPSRA